MSSSDKIRDIVDDVDFYRDRFPLRERKSRRLFAYAGVFILLLAIIAYAESGREEKLKATWNKLKTGDMLFADSNYVTNPKYTYFNTYRHIRPINKDDINKLDTPDWVKLKLIAQLNNSEEHNKHMMLGSNIAFIQDSMLKNTTTFLGTYIKSDSISHPWQPDTVKLTTSAAKWYAIKPNIKIADTTFNMQRLPPNYVFADEYYYVDPYEVQTQEPDILKRK